MARLKRIHIQREQAAQKKEQQQQREDDQKLAEKKWLSMEEKP